MQNIESSSYVLSKFPDIVKEIKPRYRSKRIPDPYFIRVFNSIPSHLREAYKISLSKSTKIIMIKTWGPHSYFLNVAGFHQCREVWNTYSFYLDVMPVVLTFTVGHDIRRQQNDFSLSLNKSKLLNLHENFETLNDFLPLIRKLLKIGETWNSSTVIF